MKVADTPNILDLSDYELDQGYHLAQQALKAAKPLASQWRQEHLAALDKTHAAEQGKELDQITKSRKRMEYQRRLGRSLARVKGMQRDSVNTVLFTNQQGFKSLAQHARVSKKPVWRKTQNVSHKQEVLLLWIRNYAEKWVFSLTRQASKTFFTELSISNPHQTGTCD